MAQRRDPNGDFDRAFSTWARRPVPTPPEEAAGRVRAAIEPARRPSQVRAVLALAASVVLALAAWLAVRSALTPAPQQQQAQLEPPIVLEDDVVVWWLDPETPVYFSLPQARGDEGGRS
jgi:hypothetical protein